MKQPRLDNGVNPETQLLHELLNEALPNKKKALQPITLESLPNQRRRTLTGYAFRNWFDRVLAVAERGLGVVVVGFFGWWFATGYGYDLVYRWRNGATVMPPTVQQPGAPTVTPLPYPKLGSSLPMIDEPWQRPVVVADYLRPARPFVPPLPPTPTAAPFLPTATPTLDQRPLRLLAPTIGLDSKITEVFLQDGAWQVADYAVGYLHGTGVAGNSNMVLAGHKGIRGAVFSQLEQLQAGHELWVDTAYGRFHYQVQATLRVWPDQIEIMYPTTEAQLTLMTCTNWDTQRFVVQAKLLDSGPLPAGN